MTWEVLTGRWERLEGAGKAPWGRLTGDGPMRVEGRRDQLVGRARERYASSKR